MTDSDIERRRQKKRAEEIAIEIRQAEKEYEKLLRDSIRTLEISGKDYNQEVLIITRKRDGTVKRIIEKLGSALATGIFKDAPDKISGKLKRDLKEVVSRSAIHEYLEEHHPDWIETYKPNPQGKNQYTTSSKTVDQSSSFKLTEQDKQFKQAYDEEVIRDQLIKSLIHNLTNKENKDFVQIRKKTPQGKHWAYTLLEESKQYMMKIAHQMTDSDLQFALDDLRVIKILADGFSDIVFSITKQREKQPGQ